MARIDRSAGRELFGADPAAYDRARPDYPEWVFEVLSLRCGLAPGAAVLEIGAGSGKATGRLLALGADPLIAIEPDRRLADFLRARYPSPVLRIIAEPFETASPDRSDFDLVICAGAFHWLEEHAALAKIATVLRPGGWWAAVWNVFGDDRRPDPFHEATRNTLAALASPSDGRGGVPFATDAKVRLAALERTGAFEDIRHQTSSWSLRLDADETVALYATYSDVAARADKKEVLADIHRIASEGFGGRVTRNMITSLYTARRR
ncbi:MAG: class I SAM-dependent methyltransferase [Caulobacteraceae bacterium]